MSKPWGIGAWAAEAEQAEGEERQQEAAAAAASSAAPAASFSSMKESVVGGAKQTNKMSLQQFQTAPVGRRDSPFEHKGLTPDEMLRRPTGPMERSSDEVQYGRLGGGFPSYGRSGGMPVRNMRGGDRDGDSSWGGGGGGGRRSYGGFEDDRRGPSPRASEFDGPSRASESDHWAMGKKQLPYQDSGRPNRYSALGGGGGAGGFCRAVDVDNWGTGKKPLSGRFSNFGATFRDPGRERNPEGDRWNRGGGFREMEPERERPRLVLNPPKEGGAAVVETVKTSNKSNPFGAARPREDVLAEKGLDSKKLDLDIDDKKSSRPTSSHSSRPSSAHSNRSESQALQGVEGLVVKPKQKVNPFGDAKPREVTLKQKGLDSRKLDLDIDDKISSRPTSSHSSRPSSAQSNRSESQALQGVEGLVVNPKPKVNPFGNAKPREVMLGQRGLDWRKVDFEFEHRHSTGASCGVMGDWRKGHPNRDRDGDNWRNNQVPERATEGRYDPSAAVARNRQKLLDQNKSVALHEQKDPQAAKNPTIYLADYRRTRQLARDPSPLPRLVIGRPVDMHFSETEEGLQLWYDGNLKTGSLIYFSRDGDPNISYVFKRREEAQKFYDAIVSKPKSSVCTPSQVMKLISAEIYIVSFEGGITLAQLKSEDGFRERFFLGEGDIWITEFYKNVLMESLCIVAHFTNTMVEVSLDPETIIVSNNTVKFAGFSLRAGGSPPIPISERFSKVVTLLDYIGIPPQPAAKVRHDLSRFKEIISSSIPRDYIDISTIPLFWTSEERINFHKRLWDALVKTAGRGRAFNLVKLGARRNIFKKTVEEAIQHDVDLKAWHNAMNHFEPDVEDLEPEERQARECLSFVARCLSHFTQKKAEGKRGLDGFRIVEDMAIRFENAFPGYMWKLYQAAKIISYQEDTGSHAGAVVLLPVRQQLVNLVIVEDEF